MSKEIISASILNADFSHLEDQIHEAESAGVDWIHLDIMDGHFVPNISFGPQITSVCRKMSNLPIDTHLMIENPDDFIKSFAGAGSNKISVHIEGNPHIHRILQNLIKLGISPGIVLNPGTPVESIHSVLHMVDYVLLMTVNPGFGGQKFLPDMLPKIEHLAERIEQANLDILIEVDGGIDDQTIRQAKDAGANVFVVGSYIFQNPSGIKNAVERLRNV